jgi:hypothetical protein
VALTPEQYRARARLAALTNLSRHPDWSAMTKPARDAFRRKFEDQVDPDRRLSDEQRARMVEAARSAHYQRMAFKSSRARAARKAGGDAAP